MSKVRTITGALGTRFGTWVAYEDYQKLEAQLKNKVGMQGYEMKCFKEIASMVCTCDSCLRARNAPDANLEKMWHKGPEGKGGTG